MACTSDPSAAASFERHSVEGPGAASAGPGPPEGRERPVAGHWGRLKWGQGNNHLKMGANKKHPLKMMEIGNHDC